MKYLLALSLLLLWLTAATAQSNDEQAVKKLLSDQTIAWNAGNIDAFMQGYWQHDSLVFIGKNGPRYGYKSTLENYKRSYPDTITMGKLRFDILQLKKLSPVYISVIGKWSLRRSIGNIQGYFTLLVKKFGNKWLIISDHSS